MAYQQELQAIYESFINGNREQMVEQIDAYGLYSVWADMAETVSATDLVQMVIAYHFIKYR